MSDLFKKDSDMALWDEKDRQGYYDYHNHPAFDMCFARIATIACDLLKSYSRPVTLLEWGCHEANLLKFLPLDINYVGFDFSSKVVARAKKLQANRDNVLLFQASIEDALMKQSLRADILLTGNCLIYVKPDKYLDLIGEYVARTGVSYLIVYELCRIKTAILEERYERLSQELFALNLPGEVEAKKHRKIEVYKI